MATGTQDPDNFTVLSGLVEGLGGNDTLAAMDPDERLSIGPVTLDGGAGDDTLYATSFTSLAGDVSLFGGDGDDHLQLWLQYAPSTLGQVAVDAGPGNDTIQQVYYGAIIVTTGSGSDLLQPLVGGPVQQSLMQVTDFTVTGVEADKIDPSAQEYYGYAYHPAFGDYGLRLVQSGADTLIQSYDRDGYGTALDHFTTFIVLENVQAAQLTAANLSGVTPGAAWTAGEETADTYVGTSGADLYDGAGGDDIIAGGAGADSLMGSTGRDTFLYTAATDSLVSSPDARAYDVISDFTAGQDLLNISAVSGGEVVLASYASTNPYVFDSGVTNVFFGVGEGVAVHGTITGGDIVAAPGATFVFQGSSSADTLAGGAEHDVFYGGLGADTLTGCGGADVFVYASAAESPVGPNPAYPSYDLITDFQTGVDKLDLSAVPGSYVEVDPYAQGVTNVFFGTGGGVAVHGEVHPSDLILAPGVAVGVH